MGGIASNKEPNFFLSGAMALFTREDKNTKNELVGGYGTNLWFSSGLGKVDNYIPFKA